MNFYVILIEEKGNRLNSLVLQVVLFLDFVGSKLEQNQCHFIHGAVSALNVPWNYSGFLSDGWIDQLRTCLMCFG